MTIAPEFSRCVATGEVSAAPLKMTILATAGECAALATRFNIVAIGELKATLTLLIEKKQPVAIGRLSANVTQTCVATSALLPVRVDQPFKIAFVDAAADDNFDEVELAITDYDEMPILGGHIDVGEAVAQSLALALDPYPRAPEADTVLRRLGVQQEGEVRGGAFASLEALLPKSG